MSKQRFSLKNIPGWVIILAVFGLLYATGLHTEAIGQVQRLLLASGFKKADIPMAVETNTPVSFSSAISPLPAPKMVGTGFKITGLDGKTVNFETLKGKVIFLNVWATWCPPCVAEMPNIQSLYNKLYSNKIAFVMLSVDRGGMGKVKKYIEKKGYTFPVYLPHSNFPEEFQSPSIPTTYIISPEGKIVATQVGMAAYDTKEMREYLLQLAK
ncbi:TlpA family protein disulfide reductase [Rufibacter roseus]|uniref:TlpA family protein disulfide reductase n=1 Tax=Rufibacter roseus TaxID=1567108 RepID=A0ABW2DE06_9BACT|nr:TlpA disulfide reductase family protein [Rufibacter roseus]